MEVGTLLRTGACALAAAAALGCTSTGSLRDLSFSGGTNRGKSQPNSIDNSAATAPGTARATVSTPDAPTPGSVTPAGGQTPPPTMLPPPSFLPSGQPPANCPPGVPVPPGSLPGVGYGGMPGDPHIRTTPTVVGGRLGLGPGEVPTDRVVALTGQLDLLAAQNRELVTRIKELDAQAATRDQAFNEALREVDSANAEVLKARGQMQSLRAEIAGLQQQLQQIEKEDIAMLKAVIAALERILNAPPVRREP